ncbi:MAG: hypothetical protein ACTSU5_08585 [Promethearchaeota archaeon]
MVREGSEDRFSKAFALRPPKKKVRTKGGAKAAPHGKPDPGEAPGVPPVVGKIVPALESISGSLEKIASKPLPVVIVEDNRRDKDQMDEEQLREAYKEYKRRKKLKEYLEMKRILEDGQD